MTTTTDTNTVTLTIDGKAVTVPKGTVLADAAKTVDIDIPVFCYHEKLGPFGCCRMCLVEVEKMPKLTTACTQTVAEGMVVNTNSEKAEKAQKGVLEFTLLNHPLDCPVCDKGGECPLQDNTFKYGPPDTRMEFDRQHRDKATPLSPVITIDRERCIACQRCTRYSEIIEKDQALVMRHRGFKNRVSTFNDQPYDTRFSGNVIDICPVGALTNTDFRFSARSWDLTNAETLCGHCAVNCNMTLGTRLNEMKRVTTRTNDAVDDGWICDKARWGYDFTKSRNRITEPRKQGRAVSLQDACSDVAASLKKIVETHGPNSVGFIGSGYGLNEDLYSYQKLFRQLGTNNIDHKTWVDTPGLPVAHFDLLDVETADRVVLIASDPTEELPVLDLRLKKAMTRKGVEMIVLNDQQTLMDKYASLSLRYNIGSDGAALAGLNEALQGQSPAADLQAATGITADQMKAFADQIKGAGKVCVIYNPAQLTGSSIHTLKQCLATADGLADTTVGAMPATPVTNAVGAMDMGVLPDCYPGGLALSETEAIQKQWGEDAPLEKGLSALEMIDQAKSGELKALVVYRANPVIDFPSGHEVGEALKKLDLLVVHDTMETETAQLATVILPSNGPGFDEGTTTNIGGRVQWRAKGLNANNPGDWKIISMIAEGLEHKKLPRDLHAVTMDISLKIDAYKDIDRAAIRREGKNREALPSVNGTPATTEGDGSGNGLSLRVAQVLFSHDKILDAESNLAHHFQPSTVHLHTIDAEQFGVKEGDAVRVTGNGHELNAEVRVDNRCNPGGVVVPKVSDEQGVMSLVEAGKDVSRVTIRK